MNKLPTALIIGLSLLIFPGNTYAVTIVSQTQEYGSSLNVWQAIQELSISLSGTVSSFTFRVNTSKTNITQFDYTAENSKIYDKSNNNSYISGCVPTGSNPADPVRGLTFGTSGVPSGFEDVAIDFSCRNYDFISGHKYLIQISNANNVAGSGGKRIQFAAAGYSGTSNDYFTDGGVRYAYDNGFCYASSYVWNSQTSNNGCNVWTTPKDDLYFVLNNTAPPPPPPKLPVIFIPGIGGSELKASQDIIWSKDDGHGGTYSHAYTSNEKIWVNQDEAVKLGDDDYFDVLRLKSDGQTAEASLSLTGDLTSFGYGDIDSFFTGIGYEKGKNFFVFTYDWRKDVRTTKDDLDNLIEQAKTKSGQSKVNMVVHSMGGLIARYYISDSGKAAKVNKLIELGVPHLGAPWAIKALMYGAQIGPSYLFGLVALNKNEVKDVVQNLTSNSQLLPSNRYFNFYNNSDKDRPYPFRDDRDIDNNKVTGVLNYDQTKSLLSNLSYNITVFGLAEQLHSFADPLLNQANGTKLYIITGSSQPTLGQIQETWWVTWPINLIPKRDEVFINGDDTVPLYSASLKSDSLDLSGGAKIYYVDQKHADLVSTNGAAMQTVKSILNDDSSLPVEVKTDKITLEGQHISVDQNANLDLYDDSGNHTGLKSNGDVEVNIPNTFYDSLDNTKHIFVKKSANKVTAKVTSSKTIKAKIRIRTYLSDSITKTVLYNDLPLTDKTTIQLTIDPNTQNTPTLLAGTQTILATTEATGSAALDLTPPTTSMQISGTKDSSGIYSGPVTITLTGNDSSSGILRIEYSLDNGKTVQTYTGPFTISTPGKTTIQFRSIDKLGNEEIPQTITIEIAATTTSSSSSSSGTSSSNNSSVIPANAGIQLNKSGSELDPRLRGDDNTTSPDILGISFKNPSHISDQINVSHILDSQENSIVNKIVTPSSEQILGGLLIVSGGIATVASLALIITFLPKITKLPQTSFVKPFPK